MVFGMYELPDVEAVYWSAPPIYLGNRLTSYGSRFVYKLGWVIVRGDTSGKPTSGPSIILIGKNGLKIAYGDETFTTSNETFNVLLSEDGWYHVPRAVKDIVTRLKRTEYKGDPVTRVQFMSVLSDIESVLLRGTFHTDQVESVLEKATLHVGSNEISDSNSLSLVEECSCPPGYTGLSCETCDFGYMKIYEMSATHEKVGKCIKCPCNGHAATCDLETGQCGECQHNTFGER
jgi:laminin, alpha 1/2